jgi:mannonate dehydratase
MNHNRRRWLAAGLAGVGLVGAAAWRLWPDEGLINPCLGPLPPDLADHPLVREAWAGLDPERVWDGHVHLFTSAGAAHTDGGPWPHWLSAAQARLIANAACADAGRGDFAAAYLAHLTELLGAMPAGYKTVLLAMDAYHDESGRPRPALTHFSLANDLCAEAARQAPDRFEWAASIHPYRPDAVEELQRVTGLGARAIKWIPAAQGIDPSSPRCDVFYAALAASGLPLISHVGAERATPGDDTLGNPLRLRRALDHGVRVVAAHCATMGESRDLDAGSDGPTADNFSLFERLMDEPRYQSLLFGDLAAIPQTARSGAALRRIIERGSTDGDWCARLLHGSDYPLPGLMPLYSSHLLAEQGLLDMAAVEPLAAIRRYNPLVFDFVVKRHLRVAGRGLANDVFHSRDFFTRPAPRSTWPKPSSR